MDTRRYYVLWTTSAGHEWSGPYDTFEQAAGSEPMQDPAYHGLVTMADR